MKIPARQDAERQGWHFSDQEKECSRCGDLIVWAQRGEKNASFIPDTGQFHLKVCGQQPPALRPAPATTPAPPTESLQRSIDDLAIAIRTLISKMDSRQQHAPATVARPRQV